MQWHTHIYAAGWDGWRVMNVWLPQKSCQPRNNKNRTDKAQHNTHTHTQRTPHKAYSVCTGCRFCLVKGWYAVCGCIFVCNDTQIKLVLPRRGMVCCLCMQRIKLVLPWHEMVCCLYTQVKSVLSRVVCCLCMYATTHTHMLLDEMTGGWWMYVSVQ